MFEPIHAFDEIKEFYKTYLETAFRIGDPSLQALRRDKISELGKLAQDLYIEALPSYKSSGKKIGNTSLPIPGFSSDEVEAFNKLVLSGLFEEDPSSPGTSKFEMYSHQLEMLKRGVQPGLPGIVTSGTGSGKTESFLLPIFAQLAKEGITWKSPEPEYLSREYWNIKGARHECRRKGENRPAAVRALILYPMNALVEDQMVRLRKSLTSSKAKAVYQKYFNGNSIFLGRYTGASPVTGFQKHPRLNDEDNNSKRSQLRKKLQELSETHSSISDKITSGSIHDQDLHFSFPNPSSSELISRWDMQDSPPDIFITNIAMLNGMLAREVEEPIWEKTKKWIEEDPDSYFYLVLDELHLHRGSPGTEISYLLRNLIHRLGLSKPENRHKLRILCSSASLPVSNAERDKSIQFLHDMFGCNGTIGSSGGSYTKDQWASCIVPGEEADLSCSVSKIDCKLFSPLFEKNDNKFFACKKHNEVKYEWIDFAASILKQDSALDRNDIESVVEYVCDTVFSTLANLSLELHQKTKPLALKNIAENLFDNGTEEEKQNCLEMLFQLRASIGQQKNSLGITLNRRFPSFRAHAFIRALDGLYCSPMPISSGSDPLSNLFSEFDVEKGVYFAESDSNIRRVEVLYCECCGELFYGGMRGPKGCYDSPEILMTDPDLDSLPESSKDDRFEELSHEVFVLFWPQHHKDQKPVKSDQWLKAKFNPYLGKIKQGKAGQSEIRGWLYNPGSNFETHGAWYTTREDKFSAMPKDCPSCGTEYHHFKKDKASPIRNFRVGFNKTSQLLSTELFASFIQEGEESGGKLISFCDSRQEAARNALSFESMHHQDLIRELLISAIKEKLSSLPNKKELPDLIEELEVKEKEASEIRNYAAALAYQKEKKKFKQYLVNYPNSVSLNDILNDSEDLGFPGVTFPSKLVTEMVSLGVHPSDGAGIDTISGGKHATKGGGETLFRFPWEQLFDLKNDRLVWRNSTANGPIEIAQGRLKNDVLIQAQNTLVDKTVYSIEEAGLGYLALSDEVVPRKDLSKYDGLVRIFLDHWRAFPSDYDPPEWPNSRRFNSSVNEKFEKIFSSSNVDNEKEEFFKFIESQNHRFGFIFIDHLHVVLVDEEDDYWRCENCGRVHLHRGFEKCTRCIDDLHGNPTGKVKELRASNHLAKRSLRNKRFRLRSEELTGQTHDISARLRRFNDIFIGDNDTSLPDRVKTDEWPVHEFLDEKSRSIDLLSVTTTMEVGVDIGSLMGTYQANMPPQRFNYQQRVGRAGRRGQPFSLVLTLCRSKSHDLYYFRLPEKITGDDPPPPFLTKDHLIIAKRLIRKAWLIEAVKRLRKKGLNGGQSWPGDDSPSDIHGELFEIRFYKDQAIKDQLLESLKDTETYRDEFANVLIEDSGLVLAEIVAGIEIESELFGMNGIVETSSPSDMMATRLAEEGFFPMYGMPTQSRDCYYKFNEINENDFEPVSINRSSDIAITEFAPEQEFLLEKKRFQLMGFTDRLPPIIKSWRSLSLDSWFSKTIELKQCDYCRSWNSGGKSKCQSCDNPISAAAPEIFFTPKAYRTDFSSGKNPLKERNAAVVRGNTVYRSEAVKVDFSQDSTANYNLQTGFLPQSKIFTLNKGPSEDGWEVTSVDHKLTKSKPSNLQLPKQGIPAQLNDQLPESSTFHNDTQKVYLAEEKVTDSIFIALNDCKKNNFFDSSTGKWKSSCRSAFISAAHVIMQYASLKLDVDSSEFESYEPRIHLVKGAYVPLIQISDFLPNGSGLTRALNTIQASGSALIVEMIQDLVDLKDDYAKRILRKQHYDKCAASCYECIQRYGNRRFHGLLDWRLAFDILTVLTDENFDAGLTSKSLSHGLIDWKTRIDRAVDSLKRFLPDSTSSVIQLGSEIDTSMYLRPSENKAYVFVHPFWDEDATFNLVDANSHIPSTYNVVPVDIFEYERRPTSVVENQ